MKEPNKAIKTTVASKRRRYLPAQQRKSEILDAAFREFSSRGFLATSLDSIAKSAGISKSGIYAHYKSKHALFEDMLLTILFPQDNQFSQFRPKQNARLETLLDQYLEQRYQSLSSEKATAAFRLLITESERSTELIQKCSIKLVERLLSNEKSFINHCIELGLCQQRPDSEHYLLAGAPAGLWMILITLFGKEQDLVSLAGVKQLHKNLLLQCFSNNQTE